MYFDFKVLFNCVETTQGNNGKKEEIISLLIPASVSICSNVSGYNALRCIISNGDPSALIAQMYEYMQLVSNKSYELMQQKLETVLAQLSDKIDLRDDTLVEAQMARAAVDEDEAVLLGAKAYRMHVFERLFKGMHVWLRRLVCLGFNTGKFDLNLTRQYFFHTY